MPVILDATSVSRFRSLVNVSRSTGFGRVTAAGNGLSWWETDRQVFNVGYVIAAIFIATAIRLALPIQRTKLRLEQSCPILLHSLGLAKP